MQIKTHQLNALLRKSVAYQKKNWAQNCCILVVPVLILLLLAVAQALIDREIRKSTREEDAERALTVRMPASIQAMHIPRTCVVPCSAAALPSHWSCIPLVA